MRRHRALAAAAVLLAAGSGSAVETGPGRIGTWTLVWRITELGEDVNLFRSLMAEDLPFPFRARVVESGAGSRVLLFDANGDVDGEILLEPGERALVAADGGAHLVWRADPLRARENEYRFYRSGNPEPAWEAVARGEPMLFAPDGSLFVIAAPDTSLDRFQRAWLAPGGRVQVVDADGNVGGELPILPAYVRMTGDGRRIAMLHAGELVVLNRNGILAWSEPVPIDAVVAREGHAQLEAAGGRIVVSGTGQVEDRNEDALRLRPERRGTLRVFTDEGRLLWKSEQPDDEDLWFQISVALSSDGGTLATFHATGREVVVLAYDTDSGEKLWEARVPRRAGTSCLSVSPQGRLVTFAHGDLRTHAIVWSREGDVVWEGEVPYPARVARMEVNGLLVAERWMVRLEPEGE